MRISDWSSDVCSSDLAALRMLAAQRLPQFGLRHRRRAELADHHAGRRIGEQAATRDVHVRCERGGKRRDHGIAGAGDLEDFSRRGRRSEEHTSELQSLMRISYAVFCLQKKK